MKWKKEILQGGIYVLAVSPFYLTGHALYDLVTDGYTPRLASIAMVSTLLGAFLTVWSTRAEPWKWIKRQWFTPMAGLVLWSYMNEALLEGFNGDRINAMLWVFNAWVFHQGALMWRNNSDWWVEAARKERDLADRWKKLYYKENKP